ncbi:GPI mannosyltransferase 2 [Amylostereum chailletii]|nr:GPI mannosyltransferase 2 [Amylostereum chailletii]
MALLPRTTQRLTSSLLRWDTFHFASIARDGYIYEYQWAFLPGTPAVMKVIGFVLHWLLGKRDLGQPLGWTELVQAGGIGALVCSNTQSLYRLSLHHLKSSSLAFLATLLSLLPSSPATAHYAGYADPFFTFFSYRGMLACARKQYVCGALHFALATGFRSNGTLLAGYILWGLVFERLLIYRKLPSVRALILSVILSMIVVAPFVFHQILAYLTFCSSNDRTLDHLPSWCSNCPPAIYSYVQSKYWNVGFLHYWTLAQLPNILLALPVLSALVTFSVYHLHACLHTIILRSPLLSPPSDLVFSDPSLTPFTVHTVIMCAILLFSSHTQIALRLAPSLPTTYWAAAWLLVSYPRVGRAWVLWSVVWGAVSVVLWGVFLPPA